VSSSLFRPVARRVLLDCILYTTVVWRRYFAVHRCRGCCRIVDDWWSYIDDRLYQYFCKSFYLIRSVFTFIIHRYIISLSSSRSCLPPCQCRQSLPVFRFQSASMPAPDALTSDTAASASSPTPVLPASYFVRDSEQITAWCFAYPPGRAEGHSVIYVGWNYPEDPWHLPDSGCHLAFGLLTGLWHVELRRPTLDHTPD